VVDKDAERVEEPAPETLIHLKVQRPILAHDGDDLAALIRGRRRVAAHKPLVLGALHHVGGHVIAHLGPVRGAVGGRGE